MLFSLPPGTEMFHFPGFPPHALYIQARVTVHDDSRVPPFGHPRIKALSATPRGLSRPDTSFIGSWYQGIHRAPLNTYTHGETSSRNSQTLQSSNLLLDARIHYPVHKHPTEPQTPKKTTSPTGTPIGDVVFGPEPGTEATTLTGCPFRTQQCARPPEPGRLSTMFPPMSSATTHSVV